jgi:hypothetical protein
MAVSQARQNFHVDCEAAINKQINLELYSSYVYMSMATFFNRDDIALKGFTKFFKKNSDEERGHAQKFIDYLNMRGGRVIFQDIQVNIGYILQRHHSLIMLHLSFMFHIFRFWNRNLHEMNGDLLWKQWKKPLLLRKKSMGLSWKCMQFLRFGMILRYVNPF